MPFLPFVMEGLTPEMEKMAEKELGETACVKKESLKKLKQLIENDPDFHPFMDDKFLLMFLRCKKHDVKQAFKTLRNYYLFKKKYSGIYLDFLPSEVKRILEMNCYTTLPLRDRDGRNVAICRLGRFNWNEASVEELVAAALSTGTLAHRLEAASVCGGVIIFDFEDVSLQHVLKFVTAKFVVFILNCLKDCFPHRVKAIHIVNEPRFFQGFFNIIRFAVPDKLKGRIFFHGNNMEELHKHIPPEILPEELGGKVGPLDNTEYIKFALSQESLVEEMIKCGFKKSTSVR
ncbi:Alpha-tocopherol transfer protein-like protein, partial [Stegodyphus mimosarum]